jgi:hypothetical protein
MWGVGGPADAAIASWRRLSRSEREVVETEAGALPLPDLRRQIQVHRDN